MTRLRPSHNLIFCVPKWYCHFFLPLDPIAFPTFKHCLKNGNKRQICQIQNPGFCDAGTHTWYHSIYTAPVRSVSVPSLTGLVFCCISSEFLSTFKVNSKARSFRRGISLRPRAEVLDFLSKVALRPKNLLAVSGRVFSRNSAAKKSGFCFL
jgi:hypothetical protein